MNVVVVSGESEHPWRVNRAGRCATAKASRKVASLLASSLSYIGYRSLARFAEILPLSAIRFVSNSLGYISVVLFRSKAALVKAHIQRVQTNSCGKASVDGQLTRKAFASYVRYWLEAFRLPVVPREMLDRMVTTEGWHHIDDARAIGKGVVLALPHVGNWDLGGAYLVEKGTPLTVVVEKLEPQKLFVWFQKFRESLGFKVLVNGPSVAGELLSVLHSNEAIALLCDRDVDGTGSDCEFFGEQTRLPRGPAMLAIRSGAALLPVAIYQTDAGCHIKVLPRVDTSREATLKQDIERVTHNLTRAVETLIAQTPEQWHLFQPNWPSEAGYEVRITSQTQGDS